MGFLRRRSVVVGAVLVVLVVALGAGYWFYVRTDAPTVRYRTASATYATVTQTLGMSGNLVPANQTNVNFGVSGQVTAVNVQPGQTVQSGQVLATLDTTSLQNSLTVAQATLQSAQSKRASDQNALADPTLTATSGSQGSGAGQAGGGVTQAQVDQDQAQVTIDSTNVDTAQNQLNAATLTAPTGGLVLSVGITAGQNVSASGGSSAPSGSGSGSAGGASGAGASGASGAGGGSASGGGSGSSTAAFVIMQPGQFNVTGSVSDAQIGQVATGQSAEVTTAGATQALLGTVTAIAPQATVSSGVATFPVTVQLTNPPASLRPGISATVNIIVNRAVHVLTVPTAAVHTTSAGSTVLVMSGGTARAVSVQLGAQDPTNTQIVSGISAGQQIVIATVSSAVPTAGTGNPLGGGRGGGFGGGGGRGGGGGGFGGGRGGGAGGQ